MRISLCNEVVRELSFARQCAFARAIGYNGLERIVDHLRGSGATQP